jgi:hypothetical protein
VQVALIAVAVGKSVDTVAIILAILVAALIAVAVDKSEDIRPQLTGEHEVT